LYQVLLDGAGKVLAARVSKSGHNIFGMHWIHMKDYFADFFFVTDNGLEYYKVSLTNDAVKCVKTYKISTLHYMHNVFRMGKNGLLNFSFCFLGPSTGDGRSGQEGGASCFLDQ
jgi:hypothetical protein